MCNAVAAIMKGSFDVGARNVPKKGRRKRRRDSVIGENRAKNISAYKGVPHFQVY